MPQANDLIVFYHLVSAGSFSAAAKHVGLTKSVISKRLSALEAQLGVQLLHRTTRQLRLTEAGQTLFEYAQQSQQILSQATEAMAISSESMSGTIRLSVPTVSGELILPAAFARFSHDFPDIVLDVTLTNSFSSLIAENFDLAIRTGHLEDSSLIAKRLITANWVICASPYYLNLHGTPQQPTDLYEHNCLGYSQQQQGPHEWLFKTTETNNLKGIKSTKGTKNSHEENAIEALEKDKRHYTLSLKGNLITNTAASLKEAAVRGQGIIYVPRVLVSEALNDSTLIEILTPHVGKELGIYIVYPHSRHLPLKVRRLTEYIQAAYQENQRWF